METQTEALTEDAVQYAARFGVSPDEALRRLRAQQASVAATDGIRSELPRGWPESRSSIGPNIGSSFC